MSLRGRYGRPSTIDYELFTEDLLNSYNTFDNENIINFTTSNTSIDLNKFKLKNNVYSKNYAGQNSGIVLLSNINRVVISNETYTNNRGQFYEILRDISGIISNDISISGTGAVRFNQYYLNNDGISNLNNDLQGLMHPGSPLVIISSIITNIEDMEFDNNFKQETQHFTNDLSIEQSQAITFTRCVGYVTISGLTIKNLNGFDTDEIKSAIDSSEYLLEFSFNQRDQNGVPEQDVEDPNYDIQYGISRPVIVFQSPTSETTNNFKNQIRSLEIKNVIMHNVTFYNPNQISAIFGFFNNGIQDLKLTNHTIYDVRA